MEGDIIIDVYKDDFFLVKDPSFNVEKFIFKVNSLSPDDIVTLNVYIFPEDTKQGRQPHNSYYEIFLTENEMAYQFIGEETQVNVINLQKFHQKEMSKMKTCLYVNYISKDKNI